MWGPKKILGLIGSAVFVYWRQTNKHPSKLDIIIYMAVPEWTQSRHDVMLVTNKIKIKLLLHNSEHIPTKKFKKKKPKFIRNENKKNEDLNY